MSIGVVRVTLSPLCCLCVGGIGHTQPKHNQILNRSMQSIIEEAQSCVLFCVFHLLGPSLHGAGSKSFRFVVGHKLGDWSQNTQHIVQLATTCLRKVWTRSQRAVLKHLTCN